MAFWTEFGKTPGYRVELIVHWNNDCRRDPSWQSELRKPSCDAVRGGRGVRGKAQGVEISLNLPSRGRDAVERVEGVWRQDETLRSQLLAGYEWEAGWALGARRVKSKSGKGGSAAWAECSLAWLPGRARVPGAWPLAARGWATGQQGSRCARMGRGCAGRRGSSAGKPTHSNRLAAGAFWPLQLASLDRA